MGRPSLEGIDLKLNRAQNHLYALHEAIDGFLRDPKTYDLVAEFDDQWRPQLRVGSARRPHPDWGVLIGEIVHNFHSALDHLVFQLVVAHTRGRLPKRIADTSAFPIFNSGPKFRATNRKGKPAPVSGRFKIQGASTAAQAVIETLQPYHRRKNPGTRALWQLHELSNIDKHRLLHVTHSSLQSSQFRLVSQEPIAFRGYEFRPGPLKPGAVIAIWDVRRGPRSPFKMHVDAELATDVTFGKSSPAYALRGESVMATLGGIAAFIGSDVLPPLCAELGITSTFEPGRLIDVFSPDPSDVEKIPPATSMGIMHFRAPGNL